MDKNVEIIDKSKTAHCNLCDGKGCKRCHNGVWKDGNYFIIATKPDGSKIAFQSDQGGK